MSNGTHFRQDRQRGQRPDGPGSQGYSYPDAPDAVCSFFELYEEFDQLQDLDDDQRGSVEWAVFKDWAERRGNCRDSSFGGFTGEGGHEHEVVKHDGYYLKRTRWTKEILKKSLGQWPKAEDKRVVKVKLEDRSLLASLQ